MKISEKKIALVTGSSRGIGRGIADLLAKNRFDVVYSATKNVRPEGLDEKADYIACNIAEKSDRENVFAKIDEKYGRLDLLVNNAGVAPLVRNDILEMTEDSFDRVLGINLKGTMFMCQRCANYMLECMKKDIAGYTPRIVNIGSMSAYTASVNRGEYCISKAGVGMVTKLFAARLAEYGIPVFEVRPGIIATDMTSGVHEKYENLIEGGLTPVKRFGTPEDVAKMVLACAQGLLDFSAGQVLDADGGFSLQRL